MENFVKNINPAYGIMVNIKYQDGVLTYSFVDITGIMVCRDKLCSKNQRLFFDGVFKGYAKVFKKLLDTKFIRFLPEWNNRKTALKRMCNILINYGANDKSPFCEHQIQRGYPMHMDDFVHYWYYVRTDSVKKRASDILNKIVDLAIKGLNVNLSEEEKRILSLKKHIYIKSSNKKPKKFLDNDYVINCVCRGDEFRRGYTSAKEFGHLGGFNREVCPICGHEYIAPSEYCKWNPVFVKVPEEDLKFLEGL